MEADGIVGSSQQPNEPDNPEKHACADREGIAEGLPFCGIGPDCGAKSALRHANPLRAPSCNRASDPDGPCLSGAGLALIWVNWQHGRWISELATTPAGPSADGPGRARMRNHFGVRAFFEDDRHIETIGRRTATASCWQSKATFELEHDRRTDENRRSGGSGGSKTAT